MKILQALFCCMFLVSGYGQYYFNDIVATQLSNEQYKLLRANKVRIVKAVSYDADNTLAEGFSLEQDISIDGKKIILNAGTSSGKKITTTTQYESGKLKRTLSRSNGIESKTEYSYTDKGLLQSILFTTIDTAMKAVSTELHVWSYTDEGQPLSMLKIKNKTDTTYIECIKDEQGLVVEERWKKKSRGIETYYYYYDAKKQLTDIVRFNARIKKFLPDFQYEYDDNGRVSQLTQLSLSSASYLVWKYTYNAKGLKEEETGFDKEKKMMGRMVYSYE
jgi:hypothetical protein